MNLDKYKYFSIFMIFGLCFVSHFLYDFFPSFLTSLFFPVNESVWEHMKMIVSSIIIWNIVLFFLFKRKKYCLSNFFFSVLLMCIFCVIIFLIMYYPLYYLFGDIFIINVILLFISIYLSVNLQFSILSMKDINLDFLSLVCIILITFIFSFFTYYPPKFFLFVDPRYGSYGIKSD